MAIVAALNFIFPPIVCVDVSEEVSFDFIVAEHSLVTFLVLVNKTCRWNTTDKCKADSVDSDGPFHLIKVLKVEICALTREIMIPLAAFLKTSFKRSRIDQQIIGSNGSNFKS